MKKKTVELFWISWAPSRIEVRCCWVLFTLYVDNRLTIDYLSANSMLWWQTHLYQSVLIRSTQKKIFFFWPERNLHETDGERTAKMITKAVELCWRSLLPSFTQAVFFPCSGNFMATPGKLLRLLLRCKKRRSIDFITACSMSKAFELLFNWTVIMAPVGYHFNCLSQHWLVGLRKTWI